MLFVQISEIHLNGREHPRERFTRIVNALEPLLPALDALVLSGDLSDRGAPDDYVELREMLPPGKATLLIPGNHDQRAPLRRVLLPDAAGGDHDPINQRLELPGLTLLGIDTTIPDEAAGELAPETLAWLRSELAAASQPVVIVMHHPPVTIGHPALDIDWGLRNPDALAAVLGETPARVVAILAGHVHTGSVSQFAGVPVLIAPGSVSTIIMPWEAARFGGIQPGEFDDPLAQPAVLVHDWRDDRLTSHFRVFPPAG